MTVTVNDVGAQEDSFTFWLWMLFFAVASGGWMDSVMTMTRRGCALLVGSIASREEE
jgi:hypothetical protein